MNLDYADEFLVSKVKEVVGDSSILKERFKKDVLKKKNVAQKEIEQEKKSLEKKITQLDKQLDLTIKSISTNEVNHMTQKTEEKLYQQIKKDLDSEMVSLEDRKTQIIGQIDELDSR